LWERGCFEGREIPAECELFGTAGEKLGEFLGTRF
jgi:hypothetical protein